MALRDALSTASFLLQLSPLANICIYGKVVSVYTYTLADEYPVLLLGLCATCGIAVCEDKAEDSGHGG